MSMYNKASFIVSYDANKEIFNLKRLFNMFMVCLNIMQEQDAKIR